MVYSQLKSWHVYKVVQLSWIYSAGIDIVDLIESRESIDTF